MEHGTVERKGHEDVVRFERRLAHPVTRVWAALTEPERLAKWWVEPQRLELRPGGRVELRWIGSGYTMTGEVAEIEMLRVLELTWESADDREPERVRWELEPTEDGGCLLRLTHTLVEPERGGFLGVPDQARDGASVRGGWHAQLERLDAHLAEQAARWDLERSRDLTDDEDGPATDPYGTIVDVDGATVLRFERRLRHPVAKVWAALTDPERVVKWWAEQKQLELREGGAIRMAWTNGGPDTSGVVTAVDPPRLLEHTLDTFRGRLRWELEPLGDDGTLLRFEHTLIDPPERKELSGWHWHLDALATALDGGEAPWSMDAWEEIDAQYARRLPELVA